MALSASTSTEAITTSSVAENRSEVQPSGWELAVPRQTVGVNVLISNPVLHVGAAIVANLDTTRVTDEGSTRTVMIVSGILVMAALVLIGITVWFWRNTVPDPDALESLVFFEERVVDSVTEPDAVQRKRSQRSKDDRGEGEGLNVARRFRKRHPDEDPTGSIERPALRRGRREPH